MCVEMLASVPIPLCSILEINSDSVKYVGGVVILSFMSKDACLPPLLVLKDIKPPVRISVNIQPQSFVYIAKRLTL